MLTVLVDYISDIRGTEKTNCRKEACDESWEHTEDNDDFIVQLKQARSIALTLT